MINNKNIIAVAYLLAAADKIATHQEKMGIMPYEAD